MKSTQCWLTGLLAASSSVISISIDYGNSDGTDEQSQAVQNSWAGDDLGYGDQNGYEFSVQPNYYDEQQLDQSQQYSDYVDELQNLQSLMEQGYGANQDYGAYLDRNNGPSDYNLNMDYNNIDSNGLDYNGLDYQNDSGASPAGQETYPSPPNPCPKGVKPKKDCIPNMPDTAEMSQMYQAINKNGEGAKMNADMLNSFFQTI